MMYRPARRQSDALLAQANPTQNTWYYALGNATVGLRNVKIYAIAFHIATTGETLEIEVIVDGITVNGSVAAAAGTTYEPTWAYSLISGDDFNIVTAGSHSVYRAFLVEGREITVRVRKTTNNGVGTLYCQVLYGVNP